MSQQFASRREILQNWNPEDKGFWESYGKIIAKENLIVSTAALTLAFCVWYLWSTVASQLNSVGFNFTKDQLFTLAALPGLVGATLRFLFTYMPAWLGGKNFTFISTLILLVPVIGLGFAVQDPSTSYGTFAILVALIGIAGANFASSMANIGNFFPQSGKGTALGINGGIGNRRIHYLLRRSLCHRLCNPGQYLRRGPCNC
jgi:Nitrate/nitrite transporter